MLRRFQIAWVVLLLGLLLGAPLFCDAASHDEDSDHACACLCHSCFEMPPADPAPVPARAADRMVHDEARPPDDVPAAIFHPPIV